MTYVPRKLFVNLAVKDLWSFYDLDGHHWEVIWMNPAHVQG